QNGARDHAAAGIVSGIAADDDEAEAHARAEQRGGNTLDCELSATPAARLSDRDAGCPLSRVPVDHDAAAGHARTGQHTSAAFHHDLPALHGVAEIGAGVDVTHDLRFG